VPPVLAAPLSADASGLALVTPSGYSRAPEGGPGCHSFIRTYRPGTRQMTRTTLHFLLVSLLMGLPTFAQSPAPLPGEAETGSADAAAPSQPSASKSVEAPGWAQAFPADAVATYFDAKASVVVVAAGERPRSERAAAALVQALRQTGTLSLVMTGEAMGDVAGLADEAIVKKAEALPVDIVSIVRAFPTSPGEPDIAVVTHFRRADGGLAHAWSASPGSPLERQGEASTASVGVEAQAVEQVQAVTEAGAKDAARRQAEAKDQFIGYDDYIATNAYGQEVREFTKFYQGPYKKPISVGKVLELADRPDLKAKYDQRMGLKIGSLVVGIGAGIGSLVAFSVMDYDPDSNARLYTATGLAVGGALIAWFGVLLDPSPVPTEVLRQLADEHNKKLQDEVAARSGFRLQELNLAVVPVRDGAVAGVSGRF
jgi:hypothetical protein